MSSTTFAARSESPSFPPAESASNAARPSSSSTASEIGIASRSSNVRLTLDRYGHLLPSLDESLRDGLEAAFHVAAAGQMRDGDGTDVIPIGASGLG